LQEIARKEGVKLQWLLQHMADKYHKDMQERKKHKYMIKEDEYVDYW